MDYKRGLKKMLQFNSKGISGFVLADLLRPVVLHEKSIIIEKPFYALLLVLIVFVSSVPFCIKDFRGK